MLDTGRRVEACIEKAEKRISGVVAESKKEGAVEMEKKVEGQLKKVEEQVTNRLESTSETLKKVVQDQEWVVERNNSHHPWTEGKSEGRHSSKKGG